MDHSTLEKPFRLSNFWQDPGGSAAAGGAAGGGAEEKRKRRKKKSVGRKKRGKSRVQIAEEEGD